MEQLAVTSEVEAAETNPSKMEPSPSFIDTNPLQAEPSFNFFELDDNAAALATTAYDELFAIPTGGHSFWNFGNDLNDAGMGMSIMPALEDGKKLEDVPEPGSDPINPFFMSM
ncbi:uncharacterized protein J3R85_011446 [Psidium guajava]|nr:uncharacterized protein J3R85_011446 [Psidium guajava]